MPNQDLSNKIESTKIWADYLKHLSTLSTGSIVLIATFLEKLFAHPLWKPALVATLIGFLASVLGSVGAFTAFSGESMNWEVGHSDAPGWVDTLAYISVIFAWAGFVIGIISFTIFTIKNII